MDYTIEFDRDMSRRAIISDSFVTAQYGKDVVVMSHQEFEKLAEYYYKFAQKIDVIVPSGIIKVSRAKLRVAKELGLTMEEVDGQS